jgi:TPR repeat protein
MNIDELRTQAEAGSVVAQTILGICYLHGIDVGVDCAEAFRLLSKASERGASRAMLNLAGMFHRGQGTQQNIAEAIRLYELAATKGEFLAQIELARIYSKGADVPRDMGMAEKWYAAAAAQAGRVSDGDELAEARAFLATRPPPLQ